MRKLKWRREFTKCGDVVIRSQSLKEREKNTAL